MQKLFRTFENRAAGPETLEITLDVRFSIFLWLFLIMQLHEICDKKHMVRCPFKSHNSSKVRQKSVQWHPLSAFYFFGMPLRFGVLVAKHMELILSLNRCIASS